MPRPQEFILGNPPRSAFWRHHFIHCTGFAALYILFGLEHPASLLLNKAKSETWLRRKRPPDKRYALRNYFQLKRGQKRKIRKLQQSKPLPLRFGAGWCLQCRKFSVFFSKTQKKHTHENISNQKIKNLLCKNMFSFSCAYKALSPIKKRNQPLPNSR